VSWQSNLRHCEKLAALVDSNDTASAWPAE
jgi:hypothetical protein